MADRRRDHTFEKLPSKEQRTRKETGVTDLDSDLVPSLSHSHSFLLTPFPRLRTRETHQLPSLSRRRVSRRTGISRPTRHSFVYPEESRSMYSVSRCTTTTGFTWTSQTWTSTSEPGLSAPFLRVLLLVPTSGK